jgi:outer membrane protein OmpA-like peptidoglycan-associated protein
MAAKHHDETSFWPGYVDAIINVVLNILFLVGTFAVALATSSSTQKAERVAEAEKAQKITQAIEPMPKLPDIVSVAKAPVIEIEKANEALKPVRWTLRQRPEQVSVVKIDFDPRALVLKESERVQLAALFKEQGAQQPAQRWSLWCVTDATGSDGSRLAYLRAMAVRQALLQAGVMPEQIDMRIFGGGKTDEPSINSVFVSVSPLATDPPAPVPVQSSSLQPPERSYQ